jgi:hypothetical protein
LLTELNAGPHFSPNLHLIVFLIVTGHIAGKPHVGDLVANLKPLTGGRNQRLTSSLVVTVQGSYRYPDVNDYKPVDSVGEFALG